jgi:citrate lyase beta subunit
VLDLEDSVTPDNKDLARRTVSEWLRQVDCAKEQIASSHKPG